MSNFNQYHQHFIDTSRLKTAYYRIGAGNRRKILVIHGNFSSSVFFLPLVHFLKSDYDLAIPDLRCFGNTQSLPIDATRGYRDWSDDLFSFCEALGWKHFSILGWSLGGSIAMQFTVDHPEMVDRLILAAPGSPYGFGGTRDEKGTLHTPPGLGSGGGCANQVLMFAGRTWGHTFIKHMLNEYLFQKTFRMTPDWDVPFVQAINRMRLGSGFYPGDFSYTWKWPHVIAGKKGVLNAMSPVYGNLEAFLDVEPKPDILWIRGNADQIVSDTSMMELGCLGKLGLVPGWPGEEAYPPQPMIRQTRYFLEQYRKKGGSYTEVVIPGGHACFLESPTYFLSTLRTFLPA